MSIGIVLVTVIGVSGCTDDPLSECLKDPDYDDLLKIMEQGLPPTKTPRSVGIIGGGIAGLTAAKVLQDAGHKVSPSMKCYGPMPFYFLHFPSSF